MFTAFTTTNQDGAHVAGIRDEDTELCYVIHPLGREPGFYSEKAAVQLSEAYVGHATDVGISGLLNVRQI